MKKVLVLLFVFLIGALPVYGESAQEDHWAYKDIVKVKEEKIMEDIEGDFKADQRATRGDILLGLGRMEKRKNPDNKMEDLKAYGFKDLKGLEEKMYGIWARENQIAKGYEDGTYREDKSISRQELATLVGRYLFDYYQVPTTKMFYQFKDQEDIASWADNYIQPMANAKIIEGRPDGHFYPQAQVTRGEVAKIFSKVLELPISLGPNKENQTVATYRDIIYDSVVNPKITGNLKKGIDIIDDMPFGAQGPRLVYIYNDLAIIHHYSGYFVFDLEGGKLKDWIDTSLMDIGLMGGEEESLYSFYNEYAILSSAKEDKAFLYNMKEGDIFEIDPKKIPETFKVTPVNMDNKWAEGLKKENEMIDFGMDNKGDKYAIIYNPNPHQLKTWRIVKEGQKDKPIVLKF